MKVNIFQGDIYTCNLTGAIGSEQSGERPVLVIQNNDGNKFSDTTIVIPITSKKKKNLPTHYILKKEDYPFLKYQINTILFEQIRTVDKKRFKEYNGRLKNEDFEKIMLINEKNFKNKLI